MCVVIVHANVTSHNVLWEVARVLVGCRMVAYWSKG